MAKQTVGYLGGFMGTLGPAIGYIWNGKWCVRSRPTAVRNPRTPEQVAQREMFKREVQLAAELRDAVVPTMTAMAREMGMTSYNLFVHVNQEAFSMGRAGVYSSVAEPYSSVAEPYSSTTAERRSPSPSLGEEPGMLQSHQKLPNSSPETGEGDPNKVRGEEYDMKTGKNGTFTIDWQRLRLSLGDVPPVESPSMTLKEDNILEITFEKGHGYSHDQVFAVVYAPGLHYSFVSHPAFRKDKHISIALPNLMASEELQVWLMVESPDGRWSESVWVEAVSYSSTTAERRSPSPTLGEELDGNVAAKSETYSSTNATRRSPSPKIGEESEMQNLRGTPPD